MDNIDRLINEQVLSWSMRDQKPSKENESQEEWPVITISREFGAHGRSLAAELSNRTGFKIWDKELLTAIAKESGADERFLASLDERRRKMIDDAMHGIFLGSKHSNTHYFRSLIKVVQTIGAHGKGIIVGRGSNYILKSPEVLRIRLICPLKQRIAYVAKRDDISEKEAKKLINTRDEARADFIQHHFKRDAGNPGDYDLVLNTGVFSLSQLGELVLLAYEQKVGKRIRQIA